MACRRENLTVDEVLELVFEAGSDNENDVMDNLSENEEEAYDSDSDFEQAAGDLRINDGESRDTAEDIRPDAAMHKTGVHKTFVSMIVSVKI